MEKTFGALVRQLRVKKGHSLREFAKVTGVSANFLSNMERGKFGPPSEAKIILMAEKLGRNKDEMLALAGKVSSDVIEIILQRPKEKTALLRRLNHASTTKIKSYGDALVEDLEFYPLETISKENHTAVVGESGSGKSLLTKYLIHFYFDDADVRVYDSDAAPEDWGNMNVIGRKGDYVAIALGMVDDLETLQHRTVLHGEGYDCGGEIVRVIEGCDNHSGEKSRSI